RRQRRVDPRVLEQVLGDLAERLLAARADLLAEAVAARRWGVLCHRPKGTRMRSALVRRRRTGPAAFRGTPRSPRARRLTRSPRQTPHVRAALRPRDRSRWSRA